MSRRITIEEFREALLTVATYCHQIKNSKNNVSLTKIGCSVKLSPFGRSNMKPHSKEGKVVDWLEWTSPNDGLVWVKWEGVEIPQVMHIHNVEQAIK